MDPASSFSQQVGYVYSMPDQGTAASYAPPYDYAATNWPLYYSYDEPQYPSPFQPPHGPYQQPLAQQQQQQQQPPCQDIPLHAPVPVSSYTTLLSGAGNGPTEASPVMPYVAPLPGDAGHESKPLSANRENPLDVYLDAPQVLFPTPSELLTDLNAPDGASSDTESAEKASPSETSPSSLGKRKRESCEKPENLNQRKAYFRSVSDNVGFTITDPDTITSHDKKRSYLECLEEYVQWLHEQVQLVGHKPVPLERMTSYRGLRNASLRTILVHKQNNLHKLNVQKVQAEERFMELQNAVLVRQAAEESLQFRRHSIAMGAMPHGVVPSFASQ